MRIQKIVNNNIIDLCRERNISKVEFEKAIGVSQGYFSRSGTKIPLEVYIKATQYFGLSMDDLINPNTGRNIKRERIQAEIAACKDKITLLEKEKADLG